MSNFKLTRSEFSKKLGIPTDTLKKRMKRGHYKDQFIFENGKYLFSGDVRDGPKLVNNKPMSPGTKRVRNRGNHFDSKNPNYKPQFQKTNEIRMLAKLKHRVDQETQEILPEAIEIAKQQKRERLRRELETPLKKPYTTGIYNASYGSSYANNMSPIAHKRNPLNFRSTNRGTTRFKKGPYEI
jgi:hypothetical protein